MTEFSLLAGLVAGLEIFFFQFLWFNQKAFFPVWWRAIGREGQSLEHEPMGRVFASTGIATLLQGFGLAWVLARLTPESGLSLGAGFGYALVLGLAFAAAPSLGHRLFGLQGFRVWGIEVGADVLGIALGGALISLWY